MVDESILYKSMEMPSRLFDFNLSINILPNHEGVDYLAYFLLIYIRMEWTGF